MLQKLIEELEVILNETNKVKKSLNMECEKIWYLYSPPGIKGRGSFTIKNLSNSSKMNVSSSSESKPSSSTIHDNKEPFSLEDVIGNVSDLIAYGKHIRETVNVENINKGKKFNSSILYKPIDQCKSNKDTIKSRGQQQMHKQDSRCNLDVKRKISNKSLNSQEIPDSDAVSACLDKNKKKATNTNERNEQKLIAGCKFANKSGPSDIYHHSCSVNLNESAESFNVPSDLLYLLKLYRHYENDKLKTHQDADNFSEKFYNQVSLSKLLFKSIGVVSVVCFTQ